MCSIKPELVSPGHLEIPILSCLYFTVSREQIQGLFLLLKLVKKSSRNLKKDRHSQRNAFPCIYEALELRDNDKTRYMGKGVSKAVEHINKTIAPALVSKKLNVVEQEKIDKLMIEMDGTENKSKFGANAILGVSLAVCKAGAAENGSHAGNKLAMQEFMILPVGASSFREAMRIGAEVYHNLKNVIKEKYGKDATNVGDEGGFAPNILENKEALELLKNAIGKDGYTDQVVIGMDVATSEFFRSGKYDLDFKSPNDPSRYITPDQLADLYKSFIWEYPVVSIEDPFDQDD
ncbi:hypothetical protein STEG23_004023 [Scotinomys teguina]